MKLTITFRVTTAEVASSCDMPAPPETLSPTRGGPRNGRLQEWLSEISKPQPPGETAPALRFESDVAFEAPVVQSPRGPGFASYDVNDLASFAKGAAVPLVSPRERRQAALVASAEAKLCALPEAERGVSDFALQLGALYASQGRVADAERVLRAALDARRAARGPAHPDALAALGQLATLHADNDDAAKAAPLYREGAKLRRDALGREHPATLAATVALGGLLRATGDAKGAHKAYRQAHAGCARVLGGDHARTRATAAVVAELETEVAAIRAREEADAAAAAAAAEAEEAARAEKAEAAAAEAEPDEAGAAAGGKKGRK